MIPEPAFQTNGPATYYQIPGRKQRVGFIGAMTNLHFCENCNKLRLTCDGKLRPCLGSYLEFDIMKPLRAGASDEELRQFFIDVVDRKPEQHDFRNNYQPDRKMIAIGGYHGAMRHEKGILLGSIMELVHCGKAHESLTHIVADGRAQMVDVSAKPLSARTAVATGRIKLQRKTLDLISKNRIAKGDVMATARLAGIQAAKRTAHLIPLCHTIPLGDVKVDIVTCDGGRRSTCTARTVAQTGVEMEALTGVTVALLTIYDMCKAVDKKMEISDIDYW